MSTTFNVVVNLAKSTLAADITNVATSMAVAAGEGAKFPSTYPYNLSLDIEASREIVKVTNRSTDTFTIVRAQEGTSAAAHSAGVRVALDVTAKLITDLDTAVNAIENASPGATLPSGLITMWSGTIANIPTGFVICDGNSSTPNLLTRFVEGVATAATNPGATGGATNKTTAGHATPSHTLTTAEIPAHTHPLTEQALSNAATGGGTSFIQVGTGRVTGSNTGGGGGHVHPSTTDTIADIRPLYYDIAFIMKT